MIGVIFSSTLPAAGQSLHPEHRSPFLTWISGNWPRDVRTAIKTKKQKTTKKSSHLLQLIILVSSIQLCAIVKQVFQLRQLLFG